MLRGTGAAKKYVEKVSGEKPISHKIFKTIKNKRTYIKSFENRQIKIQSAKIPQYVQIAYDKITIVSRFFANIIPDMVLYSFGAK